MENRKNRQDVQLYYCTDVHKVAKLAKLGQLIKKNIKKENIYTSNEHFFGNTLQTGEKISIFLSER